MKKLSYVLIVCLLIFSCEAQEAPTQFSDQALNDTFITLDGQHITFNTIIEQYKGKKILIDVWASWCGDCIKGMPKVKALQKDYKDVVYIFLSLDKNLESWKKGIKRYGVAGEHYYMRSGWKGDFGDFLDLDWIPRYVVVDSDGKIKLFKAVKADDDQLIEALN